MNIQNYLLCVLYLFLIIAHSFTICQRDFHRSLISIFTFALFAKAVSTILETVHQIVLTYGHELSDLTQLDFSPLSNFHYFAQLIHITAINFFILFLLIVAKGWPITRRDMPFRYAFAIFWILCLLADLITFYWTTITVIANNLTSSINHPLNITDPGFISTTSMFNQSGTAPINAQLDQQPINNNLTTTNFTTSIIQSLPNDQEQFTSTPRRLGLLLRFIIMLYFLLELRTTMTIEQEKRKLQFYLHFGALTMVWFVHTLVVWFISLRVDSNWQSKLISGFSSAANFLAFAVTTSLLWPKNSRSYLFRKNKRMLPGVSEDGVEIDNFSTINNEDSDDNDGNFERDRLRRDKEACGFSAECPTHSRGPSGAYDGLEMRDLGRNITATNDNANSQ